MSKRILLSTIGSRGEVQPLLALAIELRKLGHEAVLCVPPNFKAWVESLGLHCIPLGPDLQKFMAMPSNAPQKKPSKSVMQQMVRGSIVEQFKVTSAAAQSCNLILTAGDIQHAGKSIAESMNIPHVHATYCPVTLRSCRHTPPNLSLFIRTQTLPGFIKRVLWKWSDVRWNSLYRDALNEQRAALGLASVVNVPRYIASEQSLVAADPIIAPAQKLNGAKPMQTGAWLLPDDRSLPSEVESFLAAGDPPIYFGFGSMRKNDDLNRMLPEIARTLGRRVIISKGWGQFGTESNDSNVLVVDDVSHRALFPRVAVVVHHGGAGTTTTAALSGAPQVIVPHMYDQFYWAHRVERLGIGAATQRIADVTASDLQSTLATALTPNVAGKARQMARSISLDGARVAAEELVRRISS